jgi:hypothetical protein
MAKHHSGVYFVPGCGVILIPDVLYSLLLTISFLILSSGKYITILQLFELTPYNRYPPAYNRIPPAFNRL